LNLQFNDFATDVYNANVYSIRIRGGCDDERFDQVHSSIFGG
jgi:hypothetical protein